MAPARKGSRRVTKTNLLRSRKLASFLKDFDREGKGRARVVAAPGRSRGAGGVAAGSTGSRLHSPTGDPGSVDFALSQCKYDPSKFCLTG